MRLSLRQIQLRAMERREVGTKRPSVRELNAHLICTLCLGYFIDASTLVDCLHSFCRGCLIRHLEGSATCPVCNAKVHKSTSALCFRPDAIMQSLVFKLVPSVYQCELARRREFFAKYEEKLPALTSATAPNYGLGQGYFSADDSISLSLEYYTDEQDGNKEAEKEVPHRRYLKCPAAVSMKHIKKFVRLKYGLSDEHRVDVIYESECLPDEFTLMDVAYTFKWLRVYPMRFRYRIFQKPTLCLMKSLSMNNVKIEDSQSVMTTTLNPPPSDANKPSQDTSTETKCQEPPSKRLRAMGSSNEKVSDSASVATLKPSQSTKDGKQLSDRVEKDPAELGLLENDNEREAPVEKNSSKTGCTLKCEIEKKDTQSLVGVDRDVARNSVKHSERKRKFESVSVKDEDVKSDLKKRGALSDEGDSKKNGDYEKKVNEEREHGGRKKAKHKYRYLKALDDKKRPIIVAPTILHNPHDVMKMKVKLTPVPVSPTSQSNHHHHKHHHHSKHHHSKHHKSSTDSNTSATSSTSNKERLLQMRAVRHKTSKEPRAEKSIEEIFQKQRASLLVPPSTITMSKVTSPEKRTSDQHKVTPANGNAEIKRPSLEIMLVSSSKTSQSDDTQQYNVDGKAIKALPGTIPVVRSSKQNNPAVKPPQGLTITPKVTAKLSDNLKQSSSPKVTISMKAKKQPESPSPERESKHSDISTPLASTLELTKPSTNGVKERTAAQKEASVRHDNFGALDLSGKSSRKSDPVPPASIKSESASDKKQDSVKPKPTMYRLVQPNLLPTAGSNNTNRQTSPVQITSPKESNLTPSPGLSNLKTLSDAAVRIRNLMDAETTHSSTVPVSNNNNCNNNKNNNHKSSLNNNIINNNNNTTKMSNSNGTSQSRNGESYPNGAGGKVETMSPYGASSTLRIPVPVSTLKYPSPTGRGMPRLNEITSRGRGMHRLSYVSQPHVNTTKQGPNLGVRHIPNPSALFRQQSMNKTSNGGKTPGLVYNHSSANGSTTVGLCSATDLAPGRGSETAAPIRKIETMTRNIEKVAAGLTVRAVEANIAK